MILHQIDILCSNEDEPHIMGHYCWLPASGIFSVECTIAKLQEWVDQQKALPAPLAIALTPDNNEPIQKNAL